MPENPVSDPITGEEIAFARLILSGAMNDQQAAEAVGLNPSAAGETRARPRVRAYMIQHRTVGGNPMDEAADELRGVKAGRDQVLARLWELARLAPAVTNGNIDGQANAMSLILDVEGLDRFCQPPPERPGRPQIYLAKGERPEPTQLVRPLMTVTGHFT